MTGFNSNDQNSKEASTNNTDLRSVFKEKFSHEKTVYNTNNSVSSLGAPFSMSSIHVFLLVYISAGLSTILFLSIRSVFFVMVILLFIIFYNDNNEYTNLCKLFFIVRIIFSVLVIFMAC